ncbi:MAG: hypothetical protein JW825_00310 [Candidatus Methanofastidiosa archaeon]|nr:hypothetical protein [Candidatus Methanofastidiosa archaeon]
MDIVVLGDESFIIGFKLAGIKRSILSLSSEDYEYNLKHLLNDPEVGIIVLPYAALKGLSLSLKNKIEKAIRPIVFPIGEKRDLDIKDQIIKLIGVDLWK